MKIVATDAAELANHPYVELGPGIYHCHNRLLIVEDSAGEPALLILTDPKNE